MKMYARASCALLLSVTMITLPSCSNETNAPKEASSKQLPQEQKNMITTLPSSLRYQTITAAAEGAKTPQRGQPVTVHYTGWLADENMQPIMDKKFDSSVDRGTPFTFVIGIGQVIKGWDEGVMTMKVGEKRRLMIPSALGYGAYGAGSRIPPHASLIFDVELLDC